MNKYSITFVLLIILAALFAGCEKKAMDDKKEEKKKTPKLKIFSSDKPENFTAEMLFSMKRISDPQISPDGKHVLFTMKEPVIEENKFHTNIYLVSTEGGEMKKLTSDKSKDYNAVWSPDGKMIAFISNRSDETPQAFTMTVKGDKLKQITNMENGVANLAWSPDGKYISFTSEVKMEPSLAEIYPEYPEAKIRIYDKLPVRHWSEWTDNKFSHLFIISMNGGDAKDLTEGEKFDTPMKPFGGKEQIAWSPDSKMIAYTSKKYSGLDFVKNTDSDIYLVDIENNETENVTEGMEGFDMDPAFSPDGKYIAFNSMKRPGFESDKHRIMLFNRETKQIEELTKNFDQWVFSAVWSPDSKSMYFNATDSGKIHIFNMEVPSGKWKNVTTGWYNDGGLTIAEDGTLVFAREDMMHPVDLFKLAPGAAEPFRITNANEEAYNYIKTINIEERRIESRDGKSIHTWVLFPPDFDESKKYPMISYCQGGPQSMIGQRFHYRWNYFLMASNGYIVMLPNRRGVPGFGQAWNDAITLDWGGKPMNDILDATDSLAKESYVDEEGLCAVGASAGGYAAFWLAGHHEKRFKAFISHCGVFNLESMYGSTEELWFPDWEYGGPYWEEKNKAYYEKHSPHNYVSKWDTPIMITTGEYDFRVPYTQSLEAFTAAQAQNIPSKILIFPEETHFILKPHNFIIWSKEFFGWLDKYTKQK